SSLVIHPEHIRSLAEHSLFRFVLETRNFQSSPFPPKPGCHENQSRWLKLASRSRIRAVAAAHCFPALSFSSLLWKLGRTPSNSLEAREICPCRHEVLAAICGNHPALAKFAGRDGFAW